MDPTLWVDDAKVRIREKSSITKEAMIAFFAFLQLNTTVTELVIYKELDIDGMLAVADMLKTNTSLRYIYFKANHCPSEGAIAVAKALHFNTTLTILALNFKNFNLACVDEFGLLFEKNTTLRNICFFSYGLEFYPNYKKINDGISRNEQLFRDMTWQPYLNCDFSPSFYELILTTLLCNDVTRSALPKIPINIWLQIFGFIK